MILSLNCPSSVLVEPCYITARNTGLQYFHLTPLELARTFLGAMENDCRLRFSASQAISQMPFSVVQCLP